jgi:hypothetical protein
MSQNLDNPSSGSEELATIVGDSLEITDALGKKHKLRPLDLQDLSELERKLVEVETQDMGRWTTETAMFIVWLSLRKEGLSAEDIDRENWRYTIKKCMRMFDARFYRALNTIIGHLFAISGIDFKKEGILPSDPPRAPDQGGDG